MNAVRILSVAALPARVNGQAVATPVRAHKPPRHYHSGAARTGTMHRALPHTNLIPVPACRVPGIPRDYPGSNEPGCFA